MQSFEIGMREAPIINDSCPLIHLYYSLNDQVDNHLTSRKREGFVEKTRFLNFACSAKLELSLLAPCLTTLCSKCITKLGIIHFPPCS